MYRYMNSSSYQNSNISIFYFAKEDKNMKLAIDEFDTRVIIY